jgi:hypothetical protein
MARPTGRTKAGSILQDRERIVPVDPLERREVVRLTARFVELRQQLFRNAVDTAVELGEILREGRKIVAGRYRDWISRLGIAYSTARNYESLARMAEEQPRLIQRFKELGPAKLYRLAMLDDKGRKTVLGKKKPQALIEMNQQEFAAFTKPFMKKRRTVTADMRAHGLRMKVRAWNKTLKAAKVKGIRSKDLREGLKGELGEMVKLAEGIVRRI